MTKTILILAIATAFMIGTSISFVADYDAEAGETKPPKPPKPPKEVIIANTDQIPVEGIEPIINVDPTPVEVNIIPETPKKVVSFLSGLNPTLNCPDGSTIPGLTTMTFRFDEFGDIPVKKNISVVEA